MFNISKQEFQLGTQTCTIETGKIARQADGAVVVTLGNSVVLCTAVGKKNAAPNQSFFPLTVHYQEKYYANGKIPGGYFKREARPTEKETLTSRLIDRPLRPLFPNGFLNEVQILCTVIGSAPDENADIAALIGASAALSLSGMPFEGPIGASRVGYHNGEYILNLGYKALVQSELEMVVASTADAVLMVESEANQLSEEIMLGAVMYGYEQSQIIIENIAQLVKKAGKESWGLEIATRDADLVEAVGKVARDKILECYKTTEKQQRQSQLKELKAEIISGFEENQEEAAKIFSELEKLIVRDKILSGEPRIDGRDMETVRPIEIEVGILPQTHGSALFTRGETQALVVVTLGSEKEAQMIDALEGDKKSPFMLHYNFPPYSVGECGRVMSAGRREIGHGMLAKRSINALLPDLAELGYSLRVVSEITESNGSSSMASVCGTSLALMDAGLKIKKPVAGVAMGLVLEGDRYQVLTDILGDEDHLGDMDFKVAGTDTGITALQMDIKISGITKTIMETALGQAQKARLHILEKMNAVIDAPRAKMSDRIPQKVVITIPRKFIKVVIGKGGVKIKSIVEESGAKIDIKDSGEVSITAKGAESIELAKKLINECTVDDRDSRNSDSRSDHRDDKDAINLANSVDIGKIYSGRVTRIVDYGAFIKFESGAQGLLHRKNMSKGPIKNIEDVLQIGQDIEVKVTAKEGRRIQLSTVDVEQ